MGGRTDAAWLKEAEERRIALSLSTIRRARTGSNSLPSTATVTALEDLTGAVPGSLQRLRTEALWAPFAPVDTPRVRKGWFIKNLTLSLEELRGCHRRPLSCRRLADSAEMPVSTLRSRLKGKWPPGWKKEHQFLQEMVRLLSVLGVPEDVQHLWTTPARKAFNRRRPRRARAARAARRSAARLVAARTTHPVSASGAAQTIMEAGLFRLNWRTVHTMAGRPLPARFLAHAEDQPW
ncbi:hypothetical protein ACIQF6_36115 [Kitasatospora sp. NPDC092948]|uniref:hypothetical protein n=1 Tax=Kitasatospora sp. NPDC092948 TaxID=3364088 RepID=UPI003800A4D0